MKERYFEMITDKHCKYWAIEVDSEEILMITKFGRIGNDPQISIKEFDSPEEMEKKVASLVKSKLRKGYIEVTE